MFTEAKPNKEKTKNKVNLLVDEITEYLVDYIDILKDRLQRYEKFSKMESEQSVGWYIKFMTFKIVYDDTDAELLSSNERIDSCWHLHILNTVAYADFGDTFKVINHNPNSDLEDIWLQYESYRLLPWINNWSISLEIELNVSRTFFFNSRNRSI